MINIEGLSDTDLSCLSKDLRGERGLRDLYFLNEKILGHDKISKTAHGEALSYIDKWINQRKNFIVLWPRGTFKTHLVTEGVLIQQMLKNPDILCYLFGETYGKMVRYSNAIKDHLTSKSVEDLYGLIKDPTYWREEGFRVKGRSKLGKDPTLLVGDIDKPATGSHFNIVLCDDLLGETNTETEEQLAKVERRFEELYSMRLKNGIIGIVGTPWGETDLYSNLILNKIGCSWEYLLKNRVYENEEWGVYLRSVKNPDGSYFFPEVLGEKELKEIEIHQSSYKTKCQFYCDPRMTGVCAFPSDQIELAYKAFDNAPRNSRGEIEGIFDEWLVTDPAISKNPRADFTAIELWGIAKDDMRYILECHQERLDSLEMVNALMDIASRRPKLRGIIIEVSGFQKILAGMIRAEKIKRGKSFKIIEYNPGTKNTKESRIETLVARFRNGKIAYSRDFKDLDTQFRKFPNFRKTDHDDLIDCASIAELAIPIRPFLNPDLMWPEDRAKDVPMMNVRLGI